MRTFLFLLLALVSSWAIANDLVSPNGKILCHIDNDDCKVYYQGQHVMDIKMSDGRSQMEDVNASKPRRIKADYNMLTGKRLHCTNEANEYVLIINNSKLKIQNEGATNDESSNGKFTVTFRLYNDGIAFRYEGSKQIENGKLNIENKAKTLQSSIINLQSFKVPQGSKRWLQRWSDGYEGFYPLTTEASDGRWGYPALFEPVSNTFVLISEANISKGQGASCLYSNDGIYRVVPEESTSPTPSPWRVAIIGTLSDVVESTLITDVAEPSKILDTSWIQPGVVSWVYWAYNHGSSDYNIIKKYVDMAATLHLPYVLIDAEWDEMRDGKSVEDAVSYAKEKGVKPLIWYNSSVGWINGAPGPKFRLNKPEDREREFAWCERIGVAGVKIDFFSGDTQLNMDYCIDLLECAAKHHLLVNFHGATIPRGWQRTYPNLLSTEGVYGAEWYNNVPTFTEKAAAHNATLPFTRNVIGPMDYTPCAFSDSQHPHITSHAHELALTVLFESGLQHLADRPESFLAQPHDVQQFLSTLPTVWDETRLLSGYPGESVVMARRSGKTWYIAGINGTNEEKKLPLLIENSKLEIETEGSSSLQSSIKNHGDIVLFGDRGERAFFVSLLEDFPTEMNCRPRGGFVLVVHPKNDPLTMNMPLFQTKYTADPSPLVVGDTLFLYTSHDASPEDIPDPNERSSAGFFMYDWLLWSTTDMVNWTEHGAVASLKDFPWRSRDNGAWAIQTVERNGKYYLYAPLHGHGIGVLVSDSPYGPFKDPLGEPLVWQREHWNDIDPSVFTDSDGQAYMYWGNPHCYYARLNDDMISLKDSIVQLPHIPNYQEGPWIYSRTTDKGQRTTDLPRLQSRLGARASENGQRTTDKKYYLAFATTCCPEALGYAMSDSPTGPWEWKNYIMTPTQRDRGNHPGICDYKGHSYVFGQDYDLMHLDTYIHHERRTVSASEITYNADGTIQQIPYWLNQKPLEQLEWLDPYKRVEAETMAWGRGLKTAKMGIANTGVVNDMPTSTGRRNMYVFDIDDGEYIRLRGVDFGKGARRFSINAAGTGSVEITLRLDAEDGPAIGTVTIPGTGAIDTYKLFSAKVKGAKGVHDLYICFSNVSGETHLDWWSFSK